MVDVKFCCSQVVHVVISSEMSVIQVTFVYGSPIPSARKDLWNQFDFIASHTSGPWAVSGDFNAFLYSLESKGGA